MDKKYSEKDFTYKSIENLLKRFKYNKNMKDEDYETTVRDIFWNINRLTNYDEYTLNISNRRNK